ncbi:MAG: PAS domain-containing sensor histidine kinase, partial [Cyclobacteriaceae bacterium]|nr:PAS domain-containing sensor histidine kinase [Cyclobacteriaceae bacterium]
CSTLIHSKITHDNHLDVEEKLKQFKIALDESAIVAITNSKGVITYVNDKFVEISKYSREELIGQNHRIINSGYHPKEFFTTIWKTISKGDIWKGEIKNLTKDGKYYWVNSTIVPFLDKKNKPYEYLAIRYDVTKQKRIEEKLEKQNAELDQFTSIVSHDLKAPLRGIGTMVQFLEGDLPDLNEDSKENFKLIKSRIVRLNSFIEGLLEYSKIGNKQDLLSQVDVEKILLTTIDNLGFPNNVRVDIKNNMPVIESTSALLLEQLFANIISNSVMHSDKSEIHISIEHKTKKHYHEFHIADNGPGISPHLRDRVFKMFQTLKTKDEKNSTGIGLAIVKKIANELNGSITIENNDPCGAIFIFSHPK